MGEQKNLFLAIGLSIAIIVIFQILFPQQPVIENNDNKNIPEETQSLTSIEIRLFRPSIYEYFLMAACGTGSVRWGGC